jgi:hypothetical protein
MRSPNPTRFWLRLYYWNPNWNEALIQRQSEQRSAAGLGWETDETKPVKRSIGLSNPKHIMVTMV